MRRRELPDSVWLATVVVCVLATPALVWAQLPGEDDEEPAGVEVQDLAQDALEQAGDLAEKQGPHLRERSGVPQRARPVGTVPATGSSTAATHSGATAAEEGAHAMGTFGSYADDGAHLVPVSGTAGLADDGARFGAGAAAMSDDLARAGSTGAIAVADDAARLGSGMLAKLAAGGAGVLALLVKLFGGRKE